MSSNLYPWNDSTNCFQYRIFHQLFCCIITNQPTNPPLPPITNTEQHSYPSSPLQISCKNKHVLCQMWQSFDCRWHTCSLVSSTASIGLADVLESMFFNGLKTIPFGCRRFAFWKCKESHRPLTLHHTWVPSIVEFDVSLIFFHISLCSSHWLLLLTNSQSRPYFVNPCLFAIPCLPFDFPTL